MFTPYHREHVLNKCLQDPYAAIDEAFQESLTNKDAFTIESVVSEFFHDKASLLRIPKVLHIQKEAFNYMLY